ncbi:alpha/beta fold hydrolase [Streptomyces hirsutus]|uniref:alpha/beta fold hydrolase n=1 Tax=Streptomyces hirsutus TaxID=35620 RepID=UPI003626820B
MHGFPDSSRFYDRLLPHLEGRMPVVRFDFLGWGKSDKPRGYAYDDRAPEDAPCGASTRGLSQRPSRRRVAVPHSSAETNAPTAGACTAQRAGPTQVPISSAAFAPPRSVTTSSGPTGHSGTSQACP